MNLDEYEENASCVDCGTEVKREDIRITEYDEVICYNCSFNYNQCDMCRKFTKKELSGPSKFGYICEECQAE